MRRHRRKGPRLQQGNSRLRRHRGHANSSEGNTAAAEQFAKLAANPSLSIFLRTLDSLETQLKERSVFVLEPSFLPGLELFRSGQLGETGLPKP